MNITKAVTFTIEINETEAKILLGITRLEDDIIAAYDDKIEMCWGPDIQKLLREIRVALK